jgi:hypothetical protein
MRKNKSLYCKLSPILKEAGISYKEFLQESSTKSSCWFSNLPLFVHRARSLVHELRDKHVQIFNTRNIQDLDSVPALTAKTCPAVRSILDNSILVKAPVDLAITIKNDGSYIAQPSTPEFMGVSEHPVAQVESSDAASNKVFEGALILKLALEMSVSNFSGSSLVFMQPTYHTKVPYLVVPGVVPSSYLKTWKRLNIIAIFEIPKEGYVTHLIRKGDILAYLWSEDNLTVVESSEHKGVKIKDSFRTKFIKGYHDSSN